MKYSFLINRYDKLYAKPRKNNQAYNGSFFMMDAGSRKEVWEEFHRDPEAALKYVEQRPDHLVGTDQAWIQHILGDGEKTVGVEHGFYECRSIGKSLPNNASVVFFSGPIDPNTTDYEWVKKCYQ